MSKFPNHKIKLKAANFLLKYLYEYRVIVASYFCLNCLVKFISTVVLSG